MHTLGAMGLIKREKTIIIIIIHVQNDICYIIIEKKSSSKFHAISCIHSLHSLK